MHDGYKYRVWYTNFNMYLQYVESYDRVNWSERTRVPIVLGIGIWHQEITFTGERYEALMVGADWGNWPEFRLFYATSDDGLDFGAGKEIIISNISPELYGMGAHKSSFVRRDGIYQFYIAVVASDNTWRLFYFEIAEENLYRIFACNMAE